MGEWFRLTLGGAASKGPEKTKKVFDENVVFVGLLKTGRNAEVGVRGAAPHLEPHLKYNPDGKARLNVDPGCQPTARRDWKISLNMKPTCSTYVGIPSLCNIRLSQSHERSHS